jgi:excisionase family DNA binding protein
MQLPQAIKFLGICRSKLYELIAMGELEAKKSGRSLLITTSSMRAYIERLPAATIKSARAMEKLAKQQAEATDAS